jgi:hypothetical protein
MEVGAVHIVKISLLSVVLKYTNCAKQSPRALFDPYQPGKALCFLICVRISVHRGLMLSFELSLPCF